jgi:hypothetical protein
MSGLATAPNTMFWKSVSCEVELRHDERLHVRRVVALPAACSRKMRRALRNISSPCPSVASDSLVRSPNA